MIELKPQQEVKTIGEHFALELANMIANNRSTEASAKLKAYADEMKLVYWEYTEIARIASCMVHNAKWKK